MHYFSTSFIDSSAKRHMETAFFSSDVISAKLFHFFDLIIIVTIIKHNLLTEPTTKIFLILLYV